MTYWFQFFINGITKAIEFLKSIEIAGISLWSFILSVIIINMVITLLLNVVRRDKGE